MFRNVAYRAYRYIDQLADQLVLEICHIITHISSDFFSYLESTMPISVKLCMALVEQKTFAVSWSSPCGMHISIDAIGITKQCSTDAKYWAGLSEVGLLTQQIGFS